MEPEQAPRIDVGAWVATGARCIAVIVVTWSTVLVTGWPAVPVAVVVIMAVGLAALAAPRRRARALRWVHHEWSIPRTCAQGHCLYCCDCPGCTEDRARALRLGIAITYRGPR